MVLTRKIPSFPDLLVQHTVGLGLQAWEENWRHGVCSKSNSSQRKSKSGGAAVLGDTTQIRIPKFSSALNPGVQEHHGTKTTPNSSPHSPHQGHPATWDHRFLFPHVKNYFLGPRNLKGKDRSAEQEDVYLSKRLVTSPPPRGKRRLLASWQLWPFLTHPSSEQDTVEVYPQALLLH